MPVFLIRHPPPIIDSGVCYGRLDVDCQDPEPFARQLRPQLPAGLVVYSSPLRRALRLAQELSPHTPVCIDPRLAEIDFGAWEGQRWDDIDRHGIDAWATNVSGFTPPGGESVADLQARACHFAATLKGDAIVVTHAGIMRALACHWRQWPITRGFCLNFPFGEAVRFELSG